MVKTGPFLPTVMILRFITLCGIWEPVRVHVLIIGIIFLSLLFDDRPISHGGPQEPERQ